MSILQQLMGLSGSNNSPQPNPTPQPQPQPEPDATPEPQGLDKFLEVINHTPDPKDQPEPFDPNKLITVDPENLQKEVSKLNFVEGVITKDDAQAMLEGGEKSLAAMVGILNKFGQKLYAQSALASKTIAGTTLEKSLSHVDERINKSLYKDKVYSTLTQDNPALAHPAARIMIDALIPKIEAKYPGASPAEIKEKATEYFLEFSKQLNPQQQTQDDKKSEGDVDWLEFIKE